MLKRVWTIVTLLALTGIGAAQDFYHRPSLFAGSNILSLATFEEVQKELKFSSDDSKVVEDTLSKYGESAMNAFQESNGDMPKMQAAITALSVKFDGDYLKTLAPDRATRLKQLFVQFTGAAVLARDDFAQDIGLTEDQKTKVKQLQGDEGKKIGDLFQSGGGDPESMAPAMKKLREQFKGDVTALLTDDQKKKLETMKGAAFEFKKDGAPLSNDIVNQSCARTSRRLP